MTEKDCRKLNRSDLIEIISQLQKEKTNLHNRIDIMQKELDVTQRGKGTK
ncbi:MAG: hypothetical protein WCQ94_09590 [Lachnospiraceae bacterium]|nr:hypothetical protein [Lachnospiraceae bacterium]